MATVSRKTIDYSLSIHTKDKYLAGTDNDVYIIVYGLFDGEEVQTSEINLSSKVNGNAFERDDTHNLSFQWEDIGRPTKIKLRLSNDLLDNWYFDWCTIKRNGPETEEEDPEINKKVTFNGDHEFSRKEEHMYEADLGALREEVVKITERAVNGGTEFIALTNGCETSIKMSFEREENILLERSTIVQGNIGHQIQIGGEGGYSAGNTGGFGGKGSFSYGFSYNKLESVTNKTSQSISNRYAKETSVTIRAKDNDETTFAIVYEQTILEVVRKRKDKVISHERTDIVNLGRRVRAVLPLVIENGKYVYKSKLGKTYEKDNLWAAVN
ncbi:MAG: hypothetical protein IJA32_00905 [Lachnospiraceae bacterium]|nr:hypothetical protein [Agathobacter sp.]MBQ3512345.1 hypothetical protein [Lachnospiraceae bacterium]